MGGTTGCCVLFWTNLWRYTLQNINCTATSRLTKHPRKVSKTCWRRTGDFISNVLLWTPIHKQTSKKNCILQLSVNIGWIEDMAKVNLIKRGKWEREREREREGVGVEREPWEFMLSARFHDDDDDDIDKYILFSNNGKIEYIDPGRHNRRWHSWIQIYECWNKW